MELTERLIRGCALAVILTTAACHCALGSGQGIEAPRATVHVKVFNCFGRKISTAEIRLASEDRKTEFNSHGKVHIFKNVPFGSYTLTGWDNGGGVTRRTVIVNAGEVWIHAGFSLPMGDRLWPPGDLSLIGDVHPVPRDDSWWLKVQGVFLSDQREGPIQTTGAFHVGGLQMGLYTVQIFEGSQFTQNRIY